MNKEFLQHILDSTLDDMSLIEVVRISMTLMDVYSPKDILFAASPVLDALIKQLQKPTDNPAHREAAAFMIETLQGLRDLGKRLRPRASEVIKAFHEQA